LQEQDLMLLLSDSCSGFCFPQRSRRDSQLRDERWSTHRHAAKRMETGITSISLQETSALQDTCFGPDT